MLCYVGQVLQPEGCWCPFQFHLPHTRFSFTPSCRPRRNPLTPFLGLLSGLVSAPCRIQVKLEPVVKEALPHPDRGALSFSLPIIGPQSSPKQRRALTPVSSCLLASDLSTEVDTPRSVQGVQWGVSLVLV